MNGLGRSGLSSGMALVLIAAAVGVPVAAAAPSDVDHVTPALLDEAEAAAAAEDTPAAGQIKLQKRQSASAVAERKRSKTAYRQPTDKVSSDCCVTVSQDSWRQQRLAGRSLMTAGGSSSG